MKNHFHKLLSLLAVLGIVASAHGLTIIPTFDSSITTNANAGAMIAGINAAIQVFQANITDPVTVKILFVDDPTVGLGQSLTWRSSYSYSAYLGALKNGATSSYDANAIARLPNSATDPVIGGNQIRMTLALARRMGLETAYGPDGFDSTISVKMSIANFSRPPTDPDKYDLQQVVEHEIDEVLGSSSGLPVSSPIFPIDLFRYTTNLVRTFTTNGDNAYFSVDGTNLLARFNMNSGGDYSDWWSYTAHWAPPGVIAGPQVQDAFNTPGVAVDMGLNEYAMLDVIGWTLSASANALLNPPTVAITAPTPGAILTSSPIQTVTGTAEDNTAALTSVRIALKRNSDNVWYNFTANSWGTSTFNSNNNTVAATGTASWSAQLPGLANGNYTLQAQAFDTYNHGSKPQTVSFTISVTPPSVAFSPLTNTTTVFDFSQLGGTISRPATVTFRIQQYDTAGNNDLYWNGTAFVASSVYLPATVTGGNWSPAVSLPSRGQTRYGPYFLRVAAIDAGGNASTNEILVTRSATDTTPPIVTLDNIHNGDVITNSFLPGLSGSALDFESGIASVSVYLNRFGGPDILYWNGSTWSSTPAALNASYNPQTVAWQVTDSLPSGGNLPNAPYQVQVSVQNNESPNGIRLLSVSFTVDYHPVYVWTAGSWYDQIPGNENYLWDNSANWDIGSTPDSNSVVIINGSVTATGSKAVYALEMNGGSLNMSGLLVHKRLNLKGGSLFGGMLNLASNAVCNWSAGDISGDWNILPGATFNLATTGTVNMNGGSINNSGLLVWTNSGNLWAGNGTIISNTAVIDLRGDAGLHYNNSGQLVRLLNKAPGTIRKSAGTNSLFAGEYGGWSFENEGQIDIQTGTLQLAGDRNYLLDGGRITGAGRLAEISGTVNLTGTTIFTNGTFAEISGQLVGNGQFSGAGTFDWQGGNINNTASITLGSSMQLLLSTTADKWLGNLSMLNNLGTALVIGPGNFQITSGATFNNSGLFEARTNLLFFYDNGGNRPAFNNLPGGTFRKIGTNLVTFSTAYGGPIFNNTGLVDVQGGKLQFGGGGASSGEFAASAAGEIEFNGNTQVLQNGASFTGLGVSRILGGGRVNLGNTGSGSVTLNGNLELANGGNFGGTGKLLGSGSFNWKGGYMDATFTLGTSATMNISGPDGKTFEYGRLANEGTINFLNDGWVLINAGGRWTNSGLFNAQGTGTLTYNNAGSVPAFDNGPTGTLRKSGATTNRFGADYGGIVLNNWGTIDIQGGVLQLDQNQKNFYTGAITGSAGLRSSSGSVTLAGNTTLNGAFELANGVLNGAGGFNGNGTFQWTGGQISGAFITNGPALTTVISSGTDKWLINSSIFQQNGGTIVTEPGNIYISSGATFNNAGLFEIRTNTTFMYDNGGSRPAFNNLASGVIRKISTNTANFSFNYGGIILNNNGKVDAQGGKLQFGGGGSSSGEFSAATGGEIEFTSQTQTLLNGASFTGTGVSRVNGGRLDLNNTGSGAVTLNGNLELVNNGVFGGTGQLLGAGAFNWKGGFVDAVVTLGPTVTMNISGSDSKNFQYGRLANLGTINWFNDGAVIFAAGARLTNSGVFHAQGTANLTYNNAGSYPGFDNGPTGTLRKSGATTNRFGADYGGVPFNNWGSVEVLSGVLQLEQSQKTFYGGNIIGTAPLKNTSGTLMLAGTTTVNGIFEFAGGTFTGAGNFNGSGTWNWTGGTISGAQLTNGPALTLFIAPGTDKYLADFSILQQNGTTIVTEPGTVILASSATFNNGGIFEVQTNTTFMFNNAGSYPTFNNQPGATVRKTGVGNALFSGAYGGIRFNNSGLIDLRSGNLGMDGQNTSTGTAQLRIALASTNTPRETFAGNFDRAGSLTITLTNGFVPTNGMTFTVATHSSASGQFSPVNLPTLPFPLQWKLAYNATDTTVSVQNAHVLSTSSAPAGGQFNLNFNGPAATAAVLQASTNLTVWVPIQTNAPFTGTFNFVDLQATNRPAKFYRVMVSP